MKLSHCAFVFCLLAAAASCLIETCEAQRGAITLPRDLAELSTTADRIVQGTVEDARVEPDPSYQHLQTLLLTVQVSDVLKGTPASVLTFRQFIWDPRDISNAAGYRVGDQVLLFLNRSTKIGLTSPVGLEQGRFRIFIRGGNQVAMNVNGNAGLLSDALTSGPLRKARLSTATRSTLQTWTQGAIPLSALKESVRALVAQNQASAK